MFWCKNIKLLHKRCDSIFNITQLIDKRIKEIYKEKEDELKNTNQNIEEIYKQLAALDQMDKGLLECIKSDRKDLTMIIQLVKKLQTKTKKGK